MSAGTGPGTARGDHREPDHGTHPLTCDGTDRNRIPSRQGCSPLPIGGTTRPTDVLAALGYNRPSWQRDALCREHPTLAWFPERGQPAGPALRICGNCLVRAECLDWALADPTLDSGVLGGMTARARAQARHLQQRRRS